MVYLLMIYGLIAAGFVVGLIIIHIVTGLVVDENRNTISLFKTDVPEKSNGGTDE